MPELIRHDDTTQRVVPAGKTYKPGELRPANDGRIGIVQGLAPVAEGGIAVLLMKGTVKARGAATVALGAVAAVDEATQTIVASGTALSVKAGITSKAFANGVDGQLELNQWPQP